MDFLKFKRESLRFDSYDPLGDLTKPEVSGLIACEKDFELATPNLSRQETVTLVASNADTKQAILLKLKWRPTKEGLVSVVSELTLINDESHYQYEQIETYKPTKSNLRPSYFMQYGSAGSNLKFIIFSPYRRMRVVFRGHMKVLGTDKSIFVKLNVIICPTSKIFDFIDQFNPECFRKIYRANKLTRNYNQALSELLFHDRHEQLVRVQGELTISGETKKIIFTWGFHVRQFIEAHKSGQEAKIRTKRIIAHISNGQAFHIGSRSIDQDRVDFGYTCFEIMPMTEPIDAPPELNWEQIDEQAKEFKFTVSGQTKRFEVEAKRSGFAPFYKIDMGGQPGWAIVLPNDVDAFDSLQELESIEQNRDELSKALENGLVAKTVTLDHLDHAYKPLVVNILDPACACSDIVGSKASSLAQLTAFSAKGDYLIPHGFVFTRFAHDLILEQNPGLKLEIERLEKLLGECGSVNELKPSCDHLQKLVEEATFPVELHQELEKSLLSSYGDMSKLEELSFAVRSSSWGEDEEDMSAAGQLSTILSVRGLDSLIKASKSCFASKFTLANVEYKRQHGLVPNLPMAVVIQEMVDCEKAGVMFTCDPTNGDGSVLTITANYGLGESVVSGQTDPDSIRVRQVVASSDLSIESITVGQKRVVINGDGQQTNGEAHDKSKCCLTDEEIIKLAKCGQKVASYFRCPRDIEWGFKDGRLSLFQSRPVTGLDNYSEFELIHESDQPSRSEVDFSTRANIGEVMPFAIRPLTLTCSIFAWSVTGYRLYSKLTKLPIGLCPQASAEISYDSYHSFFNLKSSSLFPMSDGIKEKSIVAKAIEISFFGHEVDPQPELLEVSKGFTRINIFSGPRFDFLCLPLKLMPITKVRREKQVMSNLRNKVVNLKLATGYTENKLVGLLNQIKNIPRDAYTAWENHILIIMLAGTANMILSSVLSKYIKDPVQLSTAISKFLAISPDVISAEIPSMIDKIAKLIEAKGMNFLEMSDLDALDMIENEGGELEEEFKTFLNRFGHRGYGEFELAFRSWREDKELLIRMLKKNCMIEKSESTNVKDKLVTVQQVIESLDLKLPITDRLLIKYVLAPKCMTLVAAREITKDILVEYSDIMREATRMLAKELRLQLRIPDEDLLYYIYFDELDELVREPQPSLIVQALRRRNMFRKCFKEPWKFDEIISGHNHIPNHLKPSKELDEKLSNAPKLYGTPACSGRVRAKVCLVRDYNELEKVRPGEILLTHSTDIGFSPVFPLIVGIITEVGGLISHGAVVAREYGLPSLLGIPEVTRILEDGEEIVLDADNGVIIRLGDRWKVDGTEGV